MTTGIRTIAIFAIAVASAGCGSGGHPAAVPTAPHDTATPARKNSPAGDIPDDQVFVPFNAPSGLYTVSVPEGWTRTTDGTATVFTDQLNTVSIEEVPQPTAPNTESAAVDELPAIASSVPGYRAGTVTAIQCRAGPVIVLTYQGAAQPDPATGTSDTDAVERYEYWHAGREVVLTLSGPVGADNGNPWRTVTDSLRWQ